MLIDCISDLHGHYPKLEGGDLLIVAGDLTSDDSSGAWCQFETWITDLNYHRKIVIGGNHDNFFVSAPAHNIAKYWDKVDTRIYYLCDSGVNLILYDNEPKPLNQDCLDIKDLIRPYPRSIKIWGSPWTKTFPGMNPRCKAFTVDTEEELAEKWALIPHDVDILVTHSPPFHGSFPEDNSCEAYVKLDRTVRGEHVGSRTLLKKCDPDDGLRLHVFGHVHEGYGHYHEKNSIFTIDLVNASHVNEDYEPVNKPIRIEL